MPPTPGKPLPRGRHGIPTDRIRGHQRERLIAAMAGSCADTGYASISVSRLVRAAAVSKKTFYELFDGKEDCLFHSYEAYSERLYAAIDEGCSAEGAWPASGREGLREALSFLAGDLPAAHLLMNTVGSAGAEGSRRYHAMIDSLAERLRRAAPPVAHPIPNADWGAVAYMSVMVGRAANSGDADAVLALEDDFTALLLTLTHTPA